MSENNITKSQGYTTLYKVLIIMGLFMPAGCSSFVNSIINTMIKSFPDVATSTVRMVSTIPSLVSIFISIPLTAIWGSKINYKKTAALGVALMTLGGIGPVVFNQTIWQIIICRATMGFVFGLVAVRNGAIRAIFKDPVEAGKWIGIGSFIQMGLSVTLGLISGYIGQIDWHMCFYLNLVGIIPLCIVLFVMKEPEKLQSTASAAKTDVSETKIDARVYIYFVLTILLAVWLYPVLSGSSTLVSVRGLGESALAGYVTTAYTLGGCIFSLFFGKVNEKFPKYGFAASLIFVAVGLAMLTFGKAILVLWIGSFLSGGFAALQRCWLLKWAGDIVAASKKTFASTLLTAATSIGTFISSYYISLCYILGSGLTMFENEVEKTFFISMIIYALVGVICFILPIAPKDKAKLQ